MSNAKVGWGVVLVLVFVAAYMTLVARPKELDRQAARQDEINTFAQRYNCKPDSYVPTKNYPIRTYKCDNGIYVASDMYLPK